MLAVFEEFSMLNAWSGVIIKPYLVNAEYNVGVAIDCIGNGDVVGILMAVFIVSKER